MKFLATAVTALALFGAMPSMAAAPTPPDAMVKGTIDDVLTVMREQKDRRALRQVAEEKILPHFDFREMTQLAVGRAWSQATPDQQQSLENGFRSLLVNTWTNALSQAALDNRVVDVLPIPPRFGNNDVTVKTLIRKSGQQPVSIDYRLASGPDGWKIYDVTVETISLVTTYRSSFADEIKRGGITGLIRALEDKNRTLASSS